MSQLTDKSGVVQCLCVGSIFVPQEVVAELASALEATMAPSLSPLTHVSAEPTRPRDFLEPVSVLRLARLGWRVTLRGDGAIIALKYRADVTAALLDAQLYALAGAAVTGALRVRCRTERHERHWAVVFSGHGAMRTVPMPRSIGDPYALVAHLRQELANFLGFAAPGDLPAATRALADADEFLRLNASLREASQRMEVAYAAWSAGPADPPLRNHFFDDFYPRTPIGAYLGPDIAAMARALAETLERACAAAGRQGAQISTRALAFGEPGTGVSDGEDVWMIRLEASAHGDVQVSGMSAYNGACTVYLTHRSWLGWEEQLESGAGDPTLAGEGESRPSGVAPTAGAVQRWRPVGDVLAEYLRQSVVDSGRRLVGTEIRPLGSEERQSAGLETSISAGWCVEVAFEDYAWLYPHHADDPVTVVWVAYMLGALDQEAAEAANGSATACEGGADA